MVASPVFKFIHFDDFSITPKYQQLANSIIKAIEDGKLQTDDLLPSINDISCEFEVSRDTVEKGYKVLKSSGIINSVPGKGYFIKTAEIHKKTKIFLLFNKLSAHKKIIYDALVAKLGDTATIDFYIYNNDFSLFKKLLLNCREDYDYYVVIPHFIEEGEQAHQVLNTIPKEKLILLDKIVAGVKGKYAAIYENFETDIFEALQQALPQLSKYQTLHIIFPGHSYYPKEILKGFNRFCQEYTFNKVILNTIDNHTLHTGDVYITLLEDDLVSLVEKVIETDLKVGTDIGIISYNETPIRKIILNGITTISTDFHMMGEKTAELILEKSQEQVKANFYLTLRNSL